jgi:hypothetical protein
MADALLNRLQWNAQPIHRRHIEMAKCIVSRLLQFQCFENRNTASASLDVDVQRAASAHGEDERMPYCFLPADLLPQQFCKL